jgi:hypothetical protein
VTSIETSAAGVTRSSVEPETDPRLAAIVAAPTDCELANPRDPSAFETEATASSEDDQRTSSETSWTVASVNVAVALIRWPVPSAIDGFAGVTAIETTAAGVTVRLEEPAIPAKVAEIVAPPIEAACASPRSGAASETEAAAEEEVQAAASVRSCFVPSEKRPVAEKARSVPRAIEGFVGVTWTATRTALVTARLVEPETPENETETVVPPTPTPLARPCSPRAPENEATAVSEDCQRTCAESSCVEPSVKTPVAANRTVVPSAIDGFVGVTSIAASEALETVSEVEPAMPPKAAEIVDEPAPTPLARPALPAEFETSATAGSEDDHVAWSVRSTVRASE